MSSNIIYLTVGLSIGAIVMYVYYKSRIVSGVDDKISQLASKIGLDPNDPALSSLTDLLNNKLRSNL